MATPIDSRLRSRTVSRSAVTVRPMRPGRPAVRGTALTPAGAGETGAENLDAAEDGAIGASVENATTASWVHDVRSAPRTEWPVRGTVTTCAPGICEATRRASSTGVRRSPSPEKISVGTFGRLPVAGGVAEAASQYRQSPANPSSSAVERSNGAMLLAGRLRAARVAARARAGTEDSSRGHGMVASSQVVVKNSA